MGAAGAGMEMNSFSGAEGGGTWDGGGFRRFGAAAVILRLKTLFLPPPAVLEAVEIKKKAFSVDSR